MNAAEDLDERALAGAVLAGQHVHLSGPQVKVHLVEHTVAPEHLADTGHLEEPGVLGARSPAGGAARGIRRVARFLPLLGDPVVQGAATPVPQLLVLVRGDDSRRQVRDRVNAFLPAPPDADFIGLPVELVRLPVGRD